MKIEVDTHAVEYVLYMEVEMIATGETGLAQFLRCTPHAERRTFLKFPFTMFWCVTGNIFLCSGWAGRSSLPVQKYPVAAAVQPVEVAVGSKNNFLHIDQFKVTLILFN